MARRAFLVAVLLLGGCGTERFYPGSVLPPDEVAVFHVGDTIVLEVDGVGRRGGYFGSPRIAVKPGPHTLTLSFERPARSVGAKEIPALRGEGTCTLEIVAQAGKQYWLGSRVAGEDWTATRWDGKWQAWIRDPSVGEENDIVARCDSQPDAEGAYQAAVPTVAAEAETGASTAEPSRAAVSVEEPAAVVLPARSPHPSAAFEGGLDPAVWIVRSRDNYRVIVRRLCDVGRCTTQSYLQTLQPERVTQAGTEHLVMQERTTVMIEEASSANAFVEEVDIVDRQGSFSFELHVAQADDPNSTPVRLLVFPLPDGGYRTSVAAGP